MKTQSSATPFGFIRLSVALLAAMVFGMLGTTSAAEVPLTINVVGVGPDGNTVRSTDGIPLDGRAGRHQAVGSRPARHDGQLLVQLPHQLHAGGRGRPAVRREPCARCRRFRPAIRTSFASTTRRFPSLDSAKRYFVSVAAEGFQMGGAPVVFSAGWRDGDGLSEPVPGADGADLDLRLQRQQPDQRRARPAGRRRGWRASMCT